MKLPLTRRRFAYLLGGLFLAPVTSPAWSPRRLPLAPTFPVRHSDDPLTATFLRAAAIQEALALYYYGGGNPGILRRFVPETLYRHRPGGPIYVHGRCLLRGEPRVLRLDRARLA